MAEVTVLDSAFLKKFISDHIEPFVGTLEGIVKYSPTEGEAISYIADGRSTTTLSTTKPLIIGNMAGEKAAGGKLNGVIQAEAVEIVRIIEEQTVLFEDFEEALRETIKQLEKNQGSTLQAITPEEFMDVFEDVDSDLGGSGEKED
ncbi:type VII secretion system-associated protein [Streptomyces sp. SID3212]|uniref:type VII secretion system-associated protein n=1 Tax=unclassified Streptomyces TaxID=2593676 RepID=UPI00136C9CFD|nr:type VII secretion system-associated protein [Streptomyces sp. SID3212]MYV51683.1 type VII secretion system-associated protein [Streptomyces sp. SID3212]